MMTRRLSTSHAPHSPVRFYKIISFLFLFITVSLLGVIVFITNKHATVVVVADEETKNTQFSVKISNDQSIQSNIAGTVTSTVFYWSKKYNPVGTKTVEGTSGGQLTIYNTSDVPMTLIPKTRFITDNGVLFRLKSRTTVPAIGHIVAEVYADQPGQANDIPPSEFTLPALPLDKQKVIYAVSTEAMTGGSSAVGILTQEDVQGAEADYKEKIKEAFLSTANVGGPGQQTFISVLNTSVQANQEVGVESKEFTLSGTSTLLVVSYNVEKFNQVVGQALQSRINQGSDKLLPLAKQPELSLKSYDDSRGEAELMVTQNMVLSIDETADTLTPQHFLGMKKEEIEKYVRGLGHVAGVEVRFSPSWARSAPESSDKIKVFVRNIK